MAGERNLYRDECSQLYFLRSQKGGINTFTPLNTTRKEQAIKNLEAVKGVQFRNRHSIPGEEQIKKSPLIGGLLDKYREARYPNAKQEARDKESSYYRENEWLPVHRDWHMKRYPNSPSYFPNLRDGGAEHVSTYALTHKFKDLFEDEFFGPTIFQSWHACALRAHSPV